MKIGAREISTLIYEDPLFLKIDSSTFILDGEAWHYLERNLVSYLYLINVESATI